MLSGNNAVIHIATYGFINEDNHNLSALTCCNGENNGADLLYANDIRNEKVKADLVVLSSCESGLRRKVKASSPSTLPSSTPTRATSSPASGKLTTATAASL